MKILHSIHCTIGFVGLIPPQVEKKDEENEKSDPMDLDDDLLEEQEKPEEAKLLTPEHLAKIFVFALTWGIGAYLENDDRAKFDAFVKENLTVLDLPKNTEKNKDVSFHSNIREFFGILINSKS